MRKITALLAVALVVGAGGAWAQLNVRLQSPQDTFLVYEAIEIIVSIQNFSGRTIELASQDGKPWLSFVVTDESGNMVYTTKVPVPSESMLVPSGQTIGHTVDLLPLYELRQRGTFKVQAHLSSKGIVAMSQPLRFSLMRGRELAMTTVGLPPKEGEPDEYRTYGLLARTAQDGEYLFALVRDDAHQRVFELVSLGKFLSIMKPTMRVDHEGGMHVLFQSGPRSFGYALITTEGRMLERKVFADYQSAASLVTRDGSVSVEGGEQVYPKLERILTDEDLNPTLPPPPPKKKPWWKFWESSSASTNATANATGKKSQ